MKTAVLPLPREPRIAFGIDPGFTGAIASLVAIPHEDGSWTIPHLLVDDAPICQVQKRTQFVPMAMVGLLKSHTILAQNAFSFLRGTSPHQPGPVIMHIERAGPRPGEGISSAFRYGQGAGLWIGVLAAIGMPMQQVMPTVWKRHFNLLHQPKEASRRLATERFPEHIERFRRVKDHGRAEAALLALFGATTA